MHLTLEELYHSLEKISKESSSLSKILLLTQLLQDNFDNLLELVYILDPSNKDKKLFMISKQTVKKIVKNILNTIEDDIAECWLNKCEYNGNLTINDIYDTLQQLKITGQNSRQMKENILSEMLNKARKIRWCSFNQNCFK